MQPLTRLWSPVEVRHEIPAPPDVVFDVLAEPRTYPQWLMGAQEMRAVDADFPKEGSELHHSVGPTEDATVDDDSEVLASDPPHRLELLVKAGPLRGVVTFVVLPSQTGTELRFRERPAGWMAGLTPFLRPVIAGRNAESLRRLTDLIAEGVDRADEGS